MLHKMSDKLFKIIQAFRIFFYGLKSDCRSVSGDPIYKQPALLLGKGAISFGHDVILGYFPSPHFYSGYQHIESRTREAVVKIGSRVMINNSVFICSEGAGISIGDDCLIGPNVQFFDSDFHALCPSARRTSPPKIAAIDIGCNVFIGANAIICKGVCVGNNAVIGAGSVVVKSVPDNVVVAGNPAVFVSKVPSEAYNE